MKKRLVTINDYERLLALKYAALLQSKAPEMLEQLFLEIMDAKTLDQEAISKDVITMNSRVLLRERTIGRFLEVTLTYPQEANIEELKVSVFSPIGMAIIGREVGDHVSWKLHGKTGNFEVIDITYQPEAVGDFDL